MGKALQGEAVVNLPRALNNADHGRLLLARRVKSFQALHQLFNVTYCTVAGCTRIHVNTLMLFLSIRLLKRIHAIFGIGALLKRIRQQGKTHGNAWDNYSGAST